MVSRKFQCDLKGLARANGLKAPGYSVRQGQEMGEHGGGLDACEKAAEEDFQILNLESNRQPADQVGVSRGEAGCDPRDFSGEVLR